MVILNHFSDIFTNLRSEKSAEPENDKLAMVKPLLNGFILLLMAFIVLVRMLNAVLPSEIEKPLKQSYPIQAVDFIEDSKVPGYLFSTYNWGGYLTWHLREYPVFIDGRADLYGDEHINTWIRIVNAEDGWEDELEKYDIHSVMIDPHWQLNDALVGAGWSMVYEDEMAKVYTDE